MLGTVLSILLLIIANFVEETMLNTMCIFFINPHNYKHGLASFTDGETEANPPPSNFPVTRLINIAESGKINSLVCETTCFSLGSCLFIAERWIYSPSVETIKTKYPRLVFYQ